jgi:hypothetical protein
VIVDAYTMFRKRQYQSTRSKSEEGLSESDNDEVKEELDNVPGELISAFTRLSETSQHPLFNNKMLGSHTSPPKHDSIMFSPVKRHGNLLQIKPQSKREQLMQEAL